MSKYIAESINQSGSVGLRQFHTKCLLDDGLRTWPKCPAISCYCLILLCICSSRSIRQLSQHSNEPLQHHRNKTNLLQNSTHQHIHNITSFNYYVWHALCVCGLRVWGGVYKYKCWIEYIHTRTSRQALCPRMAAMCPQVHPRFVAKLLSAPLHSNHCTTYQRRQ